MESGTGDVTELVNILDDLTATEKQWRNVKPLERAQCLVVTVLVHDHAHIACG